MPTFSVVQSLPFPLEVVFDFFRRPARIVAVAPPDFGLQLIEGPEVVEVKSRIVVQVRRWGISQRITTEVVVMQPGQTIVEEQRQGPFRAWRHERRFAVIGTTETEVSERIDYEPPGGLLGLALTPAAIAAELERSYAQRQPRRVVALLEGAFREKEAFAPQRHRDTEKTK